MAAPHESRPSQPATHYEILGLTPTILDDSQDDPSTLVKQAYRRALLRNHPDKTTRKTSLGSSLTSPAYTVDQISKAFAVLSSPGQRAEYDAKQRLSRSTGATETGDAAAFQTGVENVDLDDLEFDDNEERWHRSCRCGNERGYSFQEPDLIEAGDEGVLMVGCQDCSLWLRVHFAVVDDAE